VRENNVYAAKVAGIRANAGGHVIERNTVSSTTNGSVAALGGISSQYASTILRDNSTTLNAGGSRTGNYTNGGGNAGN
jgi:hypothetical protein